MAIAIDLAHHSGVDAALSRRALELWRAAADVLPPGADHTEIARCVTAPGTIPTIGGD
jgi:3-hydroxyisobutyrate dehydrogenase